MPNHVFTQVEITGPPDALDQISKLAQQGESILEHYLPLPTDATETISGTTPDGEPYSYSVFTDGGYTTAVKLWGSKWADYGVELISDDAEQGYRSVSIRCQSAWSPVTEGYRKLSEMLGIRATLRCVDEGWCYVGGYAVANGQIVGEYELGDNELHAFAEEQGVPTEADEGADEEARDEWWSKYDTAVEDAATECLERAQEALRSALGLS